MEILAASEYHEYENFVKSSPFGQITQSVLWHNVKTNWQHEVVVSRNASGEIVGAMSVLVQVVPYIKTALLYAPRGPICDVGDAAVLADLKSGADVLAKKYNAYAFKIDPDIPNSDDAFATTMRNMGFRQFKGSGGFETIQARFNYRLYLNGRSEDEMFANLTQKTRYNCRVAMKHGVEIRVVGKEYLDDFIRIMKTTGERDGFTVRPKRYFERMLDSLGDACRLYMAFFEGIPVSGAITTNYAGKTCYIYGASDNLHRNVMPNYLIQWEMIKWAVETGATVYDFQGVSGRLDDPDDHLYGLYRFKKGFNGQVDELCGEYDYVYSAFKEKLVNLAIDANEKLRAAKRRLRK